MVDIVNLEKLVPCIMLSITSYGSLCSALYLRNSIDMILLADTGLQCTLIVPFYFNLYLSITCEQQKLT